MNAPGRAVLGATVVFSIAMGALSEGGWWWAWMAGIALLVFGRGIRLPLLGVRLDPATRFILRENRRTRRDNRAIARQRRRRLRDQERAQRPRIRQAQ
jgi:hypothetical protein